MTHVETNIIESSDRLGRKLRRRVHTMKCDACEKEFFLEGGSKFRTQKNHTCSLECKRAAQRSGGAIAATRGLTNVEKYGAENVFASDHGKKKIKSAMVEKFGVEFGFQSPEIKNKARLTHLERWGVENPAQSKELMSRARATHLERYGVEFPMQRSEVRDAMRDGSRKKFGVDYPAQSEEVRHRNLEKRATDGFVWTSEPEKRFRVLLESEFGKDDVKVQQLIERKWSVDFYVQSIDTYVSFDGVYWHGLDRPIEIIAESAKQQDKAIYAKWLKDRELDVYMQSSGKRLIRVTDLEFKRDPTSCLLRVKRSN